MKILIIGSGGREHTLVWKIAQSPKVQKIYCAPGNPGTSQFAENISILSEDLQSLLNFAKDKAIDLTVVGPENSLIAGITDLFNKNKLAIIGPTKKAAQIEGSKIFAKRLMAKYRIPTAKFEVFNDFKKANEYAKKSDYPRVFKADGQCLGKGVLVAKNYKEASIFLKKLMIDKIFGKNGEKIIIEECLTGQEISFMVATDGFNFVSFLPSQDHKTIFDHDRGPNTGGMGAYAPVPFVDNKLIKRIENEIVQPTIDAMRKEGYLYQGILYPGLILTDEGPKVLELNCRFGDPETQPVLCLLKTDLIDIFEAIQNRNINKLKLSWHNGYAVCVVVAANGYPGKYEKGQIIHFKKVKNKNVSVLHAGTKFVNSKIVTSGGRVFGVTARGISLKDAINNSYNFISHKGIFFSGMQYRRDIGQKGLMRNY